MGAKKSLPFFKALKSCMDKKIIQWPADAEEAFQMMKELMEISPILTAPIKGEVLVMYLIALVESISVVLLAKKEGRQVFIYFISRGHLIRVLTDAPIKQMLTSPEKSGRIAKWAIELGEHDIEFEERGPRKIQILKDYFIEMPPKEGEKVATRRVGTRKKGQKLKSIWKLYTDKASSSNGSGAGLMVISPEGREYTYAMCFEFKTTNNKALLARLRIAREMEIKSLAIFTESWLMANQIKGIFEASVLLPEDPKEARKIKIKAPQYKLINGGLYKRAYLTPWLQCVGPSQSDNAIKEVHEGSCRFNMEPRFMVVKVTKQVAIHDHLFIGELTSSAPTSSPKKSKIYSNSGQTLNKVGRSQACNDSKQKASRKVHMGTRYMQIGVPKAITSKDDKQFREEAIILSALSLIPVSNGHGSKDKGMKPKAEK
nr:hypothetical protein [Tanacetum cinerariifolium]